MYCTGSGKGRNSNSKVSLDVPISLVPGKNKIDLLSVTVGLQVHIVSLSKLIFDFTRSLYLMQMFRLFRTTEHSSI